jgi:hypothetical protein
MLDPHSGWGARTAGILGILHIARLRWLGEQRILVTDLCQTCAKLD